MSSAEYKRAWYAKNKDRIREAKRIDARKSYLKHREKRIAANVAWRKLNPVPKELNREYSKNWRERNPERKRELERRHVLKKQFGLTVANYDALWKRQQGVCAICAKPDSVSRLAVDHDHRTGLVRGLLCRLCNLSIGRFNDNPELLQIAAEYLKTPPVQTLPIN